MSPRTLDTLYQRAERWLQPDLWLVHTYTRERFERSDEDPYGEVLRGVYAPPEPGVRCYYKETGVEGTDQAGNPIVVSQVTLSLAADDPLNRGDRVSQILDRKLNVVESGPMYVRWAQTVTSFGPTQYILAYLQENEGLG